MRQEQTSKRISAIAGRILKQLEGFHIGGSPIYVVDAYRGFLIGTPDNYLTIADLKALAASALTQSPDKPKKKGKSK